MKKKQSKKNDFFEKCSSLVGNVVTIYLLIMVVGVPLIYDNSYFNILETKYKCVYRSTLAMLAVILCIGLIALLIDKKEFAGDHVKMAVSGLKPQNWNRTFSIPDFAVIIFWITAVVSTLQSEYVYESFWGNEGRYSGLFLMTLYVVCYFAVSRAWHLKKWIIHAFLVAGMIVCGTGITDYFQMDILHFREHIRPEQSTIFTSTIGNINTYTAYVALVMGASTAMFATVKNRVALIWYYLCMVTSFFAIIMGCSDNAYLALGALFAFLPLLIFRNRNGILRYLLILASFATVIQCIDYINQVFVDEVIGVDSLFKVLVNLPGLQFVVIILWLLSIVAYVMCKKNEKAWNITGLKIWKATLVISVLAIVFMLIDANVLGHGRRYGGIGTYLVFNDSWGTNRGYIWRQSINLYKDFPILHKLFGYGPDTFGIMTTQKFKADMINATGQVFDNAHNEYLQFLLTIGVLGAASYLVFIIGNCLQMAKVWISWRKDLEAEQADGRDCDNENVALIGCLFAVICYSFQAIVNLNLPIATPLMWVLLSIGVAVFRIKKRKS